MNFFEFVKNKRNKIEVGNKKENEIIIRTFHQRFSLTSKCGIIIFSLLSFYLFLMKQVLIGTFIILVVVAMIDHVVNTVYKLVLQNGNFLLIISHGHFYKDKHIPVNEIIKCSIVKTFLGISHYILVQYGLKGIILVQPQNDDVFLKEIKMIQEKNGNEIQ